MYSSTRRRYPTHEAYLPHMTLKLATKILIYRGRNEDVRDCCAWSRRLCTVRYETHVDESYGRGALCLVLRTLTPGAVYLTKNLIVEGGGKF